MVVSNKVKELFLEYRVCTRPDDYCDDGWNKYSDYILANFDTYYYHEPNSSFETVLKSILREYFNHNSVVIQYMPNSAIKYNTWYSDFACDHDKIISRLIERHFDKIDYPESFFLSFFADLITHDEGSKHDSKILDKMLLNTTKLP